jgi:hypothetical protein
LLKTTSLPVTATTAEEEHGVTQSSGDQQKVIMGHKRRKGSDSHQVIPNHHDTSGNSEGCSSVVLKERLSTSEQVDVLLALATDPNILMRQWVGLATWI